MSSSYVSGTSDIPLIGRTIGEDLACTVERVPDLEALVEVSTGRRWTYRELAAQVEIVARALLAAGIGKGDRVGIWSPNCAEWVFVQYASAGSAPSSSPSTPRTERPSWSTCSGRPASA